MRAVDPVSLTVIWGGLISTCAEMGVALSRTAYSMAVREGLDFSTGVFDPGGNMVAQGDDSPGHLGSMAFAVNRMLEDYPRETLNSGDAILCNDPAIGSGHLPDVYMVTPVFLDSTLLGFAVCIAHHIDVGGAGSGSQVIEGVIDRYQEGICFPPTLCYAKGEPVREIFRIFGANVRVPEVLGDLRAQYNANMAGAARIQDLARRYGVETLHGAMSEILDRSEREMRAEIRRLPEGTYEFEDFVDDSGPNTPPIRLKVAVTLRDGGIEMDWEGTGAAVEAAMNSYWNYTYAYCLAGMKSVLLSSAPQNAGVIRTLKVTAPLGSILNPRHPAPCGGRNVLNHRIYDVVMGAMSKVAPERVIAASAHFFNPLMGGTNPRTGRPFVCWEVIVGGVGARYTKDGIETMTTPYNNTNVPIEVQELNNPVTIEYFGFLSDTAGAGKYRGGSGMRKDMRMLADNWNFYNLGDRALTPPYGLFGGSPGELSATVLNPGTPSERVVNSKGKYRLGYGDVISWRTSGAGGIGHPFERDPAAVLKDVREGFVSREAALERYGVVICAERAAVDEEATSLRRRSATTPR